MRAALGASRWQLARHVLIESLLLSLAGAVAGAVLAWWGIEALRAAAPRSIPRAATIALDWRALGFTSLMAVVTGILCALIPAWQRSRTNIVDGLKKDRCRRRRAGTRHRLGQILALVEVAGTVILLVGAGLFIASFMRLTSVDPGFRTANLFAMSIAVPESAQKGGVGTFASAVVEEIGRVPGVEGAALGQNSRPFSSGSMSLPIVVAGREGMARESLLTRSVTAEYLLLLGVPLVRGRGIDARDTAGTPAIAGHQRGGGAEVLRRRQSARTALD